MVHLLFFIIISIVFYILIPLFGAFKVRYKWRLLRQRVVEASLVPLFKYEQELNEGDSYRLFGVLESLAEDDGVWLTSGGKSCFVDMQSMSAYSLPEMEETDNEKKIEIDTAPGKWESPVYLDWRKINMIPQGIHVFCSGTLFKSNGRTELRNGIIVFYEGDSSTVLRRLVRSSRQRNEFWNDLTPSSAIAGILINLMYTFIMLNSGLWELTLIGLYASSIPWLILLPPGLFLFYAYKNMWSKGRQLRCAGDLAALPLRFFPIDYGTCYVNNSVYSHGSCEHEEEVPKGYKLRKLSMIPSGKLHWFGQTDGDTDPMMENIYFKGDPKLAVGIQKKQASKNELLSLLFFTGGFLLNSLIMYLILIMFI